MKEIKTSKNKNTPQTGLIVLLSFQTIALLIYTFYVGTEDGWSFIEVGFANIKAMSWEGQFLSDFNCYLLLSGIWIMWRNHFSAKSIAFSLFPMILGIIVFAPYLIYLIVKEKGNLTRVLVGDRILWID